MRGGPAPACAGFAMTSRRAPVSSAVASSSSPMLAALYGPVMLGSSTWRGGGRGQEEALCVPETPGEGGGAISKPGVQPVLLLRAPPLVSSHPNLELRLCSGTCLPRSMSPSTHLELRLRVHIVATAGQDVFPCSLHQLLFISLPGGGGQGWWGAVEPTRKGGWGAGVKSRGRRGGMASILCLPPTSWPPVCINPAAGPA